MGEPNSHKMSISPIITFKAGRCALDTSSKPYKVTPDATPGYIYLYSEDELIHFCWRERNKPMNDPDNIDLVMFPTDGHFEPYGRPEFSQLVEGWWTGRNATTGSRSNLYNPAGSPPYLDHSSNDRHCHTCTNR